MDMLFSFCMSHYCQFDSLNHVVKMMVSSFPKNKFYSQYLFI